MNARIKELFNQAGGQGAIHPLKYNGTLNVEKFAELIVQECIGIVKEYAEDGPHCQCQMIKQHFGV